MKWLWTITLPTLGCCFLAAAEQQSATEESDAVAVVAVRLESEHLPNPIQLHRRVISGGLPEGEAAFQELAQWGVRTVISVDGTTPDVETAKKFGLRYVHLPHGYNGIPATRIRELAKAVRDLPGPIYIHCHHGKHRSPAAATVACVAAGLVSPAQSVSILELAGTSKNYRGLYQSAREAKPIAAETLDRLPADFQEIVAVPALAEAMVRLGHTHERLKLIAEAHWRSPPQHPDLDPVHEALLLQEHLTELLRTPEVQAEPEDFQQLLGQSESAARSLVALLSDRKPGSPGEAVPESPGEAVPAAAGRIARRIGDNCRSCHAKYRDPPLSEKSTQR